MAKKKVNSIALESMNNGQSAQFMSDNLKRAKADAVVAEKLAPQLQAWEAAYTQFDLYLKQEQKSLLTKDIENADKDRDSLLVALRGAAAAMLKIPGEELNRAARAVDICIGNYKIDTAWEYMRETNMIGQMLDDLEGKYKADVAKLGLTALVEQLRTANDQCLALLTERTDSKAGVVSGQTRVWRRQTEAAYRDFVEMLNARSLVEGPEQYTAFIDLLNAEIAHYKQILARSGKGSGSTSGGTGATEKPAEDDGQNGDDDSNGASDDGNGGGSDDNTGGSGSGGSDEDDSIG